MADAAADAAAEAPPPTTPEEAVTHGYYVTKNLSPLDTDACRTLNDAVWTLSSARPGNGIPQLLNDDLSEFWQSDGTAPHIVSIQFRARTAVTEVAFYVDAASDESYTPRIVSVRAGTLHHDLEELRRVEMTSPTGWIRIPLAAPKGIRTWYLQIVVHQMRANGRDLHLRGLRILGPGAGASPGVHAVGAGVGDSLPLGAGLITSLFQDIQLSGAVR